MRKLCGNCEKISEVIARDEVREYEIKQVKIVAEIKILVCSHCSEEIYDKETEARNDIVLFDQYKKKLNLLTSKEIINIRNKYNLSQSTFSKIMGFGLKTITRYENGAIQDITHDNLIRLSAIKPNLEVLWVRNKSKLSKYENANIVRNIFNATE